MRRSVVFAFAAEFFVIVSLVGTFRIAADQWGEIGFGEWVLSRRLLSFALPLVTCGLEYSLIQEIARGTSGGNNNRGPRFFVASLVIVMTTSVVVAAVLAAFRVEAATLLFGNAAYASLMPALVLLIVAYGLYVPCYAYLRASMKLMGATLAYALTFGLIPLSAIMLFPKSPRNALVAMGVLTTIVSLGLIVRLAWAKLDDLRDLHLEVGKLLGGGLPRVVSAFGLIGLGTFPGIVVAHLSGISDAGMVVFGITLVGLVGSAVTPLNVYLFPALAIAEARGDFSDFSDTYRRLSLWIGVLSLLLVASVWIGAPMFVRLFFGTEVELAVLALRLAAFAAGPFAYFVCLRSVAEARLHRRVVAMNVVIALAVFAIAVSALTLVSNNASLGVMIAYLLGVFTLAGLTWKSARAVMP